MPAGSAPLGEGATPGAEADLDLATVSRVGHHPQSEEGMGDDGTGGKPPLRGIGLRVRQPASRKEFVVARGARSRTRPADFRLDFLARCPAAEGVLLLAGIAVHPTNLAVDDRMDGMGEDQLAAVAPSVDIAPDPVDGHKNSDFCVRKWSRMVAALRRVAV